MKTQAVTFHLDREVNPITGQKSIHVAKGTYTTEDRETQKFLLGYPGCTVKEVKAIEPPARPTFEQFGPRPAQVKVGGVDWTDARGKKGGR